MVKPEIEKSLTEKRGWEEDLQQYIWELIQTEHSHIHQLQIVVNVRKYTFSAVEMGPLHTYVHVIKVALITTVLCTYNICTYMLSNN